MQPSYLAGCLLLILFTFVTSYRLTPVRKAQVLEFIEPKSKTKVVLIGSMHYNPHSIRLTKDTVEEYAPSLHSVMIESCKQRWNKSENSNGILRDYLLYNEMRAAADAAAAFNISLVLADQDINVTSARLKDTFKASVLDLVNPLVGWMRIYEDIVNAFEETFPKSQDEREYLNFNDFFNSKLLINAPISLIRYPLALILKTPKQSLPILFSVIVGSIITSSYHSDTTSLSDALDYYLASPENMLTLVKQETIELLQSLLIAAVEIAILGRTMLVALLQERNEVIANKILQECEQAANDVSPKTIVAVLGMAHLNGIRFLLDKKV